MRHVLVCVMVIFLCVSCAGKQFVFDVKGEPFLPMEGAVGHACRVDLIPDGLMKPGFRVVQTAEAVEAVRTTRVEAKGITRWDIHGYDPDARLLLGGALSTVAGIVVTPALCVKALFTGWGAPRSEAEMHQRVRDRHLMSWLFMGYLWAPVDYEVLDRSGWQEETGRTVAFAPEIPARVSAVDELGRPVGLVSISDGHYRPRLTDDLLASASLNITAFCQGESDALSLNLLPWYQRKYGLTASEVAAFNTLAPQQRPYLLKLPQGQRAAFLQLDWAGWNAFEEEVPLSSAGDRGRVLKALASQPSPTLFEDDLPGRLKRSRATAPNAKAWLFALGIERYDQATPIAYSRRSAEMFTRVAMKRFGVPPENVFLLTDDGKASITGLQGRVFPATAASIQDQLRFLQREVKQGDRVYVYYSGHGLPSLLDGGPPYLLARDQAPDFVHAAPAFRVDNFYDALSRTRASEIVVFMESCFTGITDGNSVFGNGRAATRLVPKFPEVDAARMVVLTAGTHRQFSTMYPEKGHRLFSYFLMGELLEEHGTVAQLFRRVFSQTRQLSRHRGGTRIQEPTLSGNCGIALPFQGASPL